MKKLLILVLLTLTFNANANVLPDNWTGYVSGIEVTEADLGTYEGKSLFDDGASFFFKKIITNRDGFKSKCSYSVSSEEPYTVNMGLCASVIK